MFVRDSGGWSTGSRRPQRVEKELKIWREMRGLEKVKGRVREPEVEGVEIGM